MWTKDGLGIAHEEGRLEFERRKLGERNSDRRSSPTGLIGWRGSRNRLLGGEARSY